MKIIQINAVDSILSTGRTSKELADYLIERGDDCRVYVGDGIKREKYDYCIGNWFDHKVHAFLSRLTGLQGYFSVIATRKLIKELNIYRPDIVHLRNLHANYINIPLLLKYLAQNRIPTVITLHDCFFFTGRCFYPSDMECEAWKDGCRNCHGRYMGNPSLFFCPSHKMYRDKKKYLSLNKYLMVIGVSRWITEQAKQSFLSDCAEIEEIYNWIDLDRFYPKKNTHIRSVYGLDNKPIILGVATNWNKEKGITDFLEVAEYFKDKANIVLVGNVPDSYNNIGRIRHVGLIDDLDLLTELYSEAVVFFNPSRRETFGKVTAEAMACGCPVVVYNNTALPELVGDGCGYIVENEDLKSACHMLEKVMECKELYSNNCVKYVQAKFSKKDNIERMVQIYEQMLIK